MTAVGSGPGKVRGRLVMPVVSVLAALSLVAGVLAAVGVSGGWGRPPASSGGSPVAVHAVPGRTVKMGQSAGSGPVLTAWTSSAASPASPVSRVMVSMAAQATAARLGVRGVVFGVARADGSADAGRVHVSLDFASFAGAYGGGYASRLHLVELPACAQWVSGGSSGAYTYSYPVTVQPVPGGLEPTVSLDYSSQIADGLNASTNNQASWIGDGWTYEPGFIENEYPTCATMTQPQKPSLDLCYPSGRARPPTAGRKPTTWLPHSRGPHHMVVATMWFRRASCVRPSAQGIRPLEPQVVMSK